MINSNEILSKEWQKSPQYIYQIRTKFVAYFDTEKKREKKKKNYKQLITSATF